MFSVALTFFLLQFAQVYATTNDWSTPCFQGECFWDLPSSSPSSGSIKIWGSPSAITDITPSAGWTILNCDPNALVQDIRVVCASGTGCDHLYQGPGPVGKLVRLPESCGKGPFARIAKEWVHQDQSIPSDIARRLVKRDDGSDSQVKGLSLDNNFAAVDPSQSGNVGISIQGTTIPGDNGNLTVTPATPPQRRSRFATTSKRGLVSFVENAFDSFNSFSSSISPQALPPINFDKSVNILDQKLSCGPAEASLTADADVSANVQVTLGMAASGTVVPPQLSSFGVFVGMDGEVGGSVTVKGSVEGTADSGKLTLFQVGIPGLDFPGILTLGPTFKVLGQAKATLDIDVDMTVDMTYSVSQVKMFFPPNGKQSGGGFNQASKALKLSVSPSAASKGTIEAHLIPTVELGLSALGGAAQATIDLNLDASASMTLSLDAGAKVVATKTSGGANQVAAADGSAAASSSASATADADSADATPSADSTTDADAADATPSAADSADDATGDDTTADGTQDDAGDAQDGEDDTSDDADNTDGADDADGADATDDTTGDSADSTDDADGAASDDSADDADSADNTTDDNTTDDTATADDNSDGGDNSTDDDSADADASADGVDNSQDDSGDVDPSTDDNEDNGDFSDDGPSTDDNAGGDDATTTPSSDDESGDFNDGTDDDGSSSQDDSADNSDNSDDSDSDFFKRDVSTSTSLSGCASVGAALGVNAGATGSFFGLFDKSTSVSLFNKNFDIFKKCFGDEGSATKRSRVEPRARVRRGGSYDVPTLLGKRGLSCPSEGSADLVSVADQ